MPIESSDEKRLVRHFYNLTNECTSIIKLLENDEAGEFAGVKEFVGKARKAFKGFVLAGTGEREVEMV